MKFLSALFLRVFYCSDLAFSMEMYTEIEK